jgi:hypothetical protein
MKLMATHYRKQVLCQWLKAMSIAFCRENRHRGVEGIELWGHWHSLAVSTSGMLTSFTNGVRPMLMVVTEGRRLRLCQLQCRRHMYFPILFCFAFYFILLHDNLFSSNISYKMTRYKGFTFEKFLKSQKFHACPKSYGRPLCDVILCDLVAGKIIKPRVRQFFQKALHRNKLSHSELYDF